ncbi:MAG: SHOCT domain-containing protein [Methylocella sp.]
MIMIGDMFNQCLKHRVDSLCHVIANLLRCQPSLNQPDASHSQSQGRSGGYDGVSLFIPGSGRSSSNGWPTELGGPASTGAQNNLQYACFPVSRRLAIRHGDQVNVYDTGEHRITGFSQQQSGDQSLTFTSQLGLVRVADLPLVNAENHVLHDPSVAGSLEPAAPAAAPALTSTDDILTTIERLSDLRQKNILTETEFAAKKAELLSRL